MIVQRWEAENTISVELAKMLFVNEELDAKEEIFESKSKTPEHRHVFTEILQIIKGEMIVNISGNQLLLRAGDKIEIPGNTKHAYQNNADYPCLTLVAYRSV